MGDAPWTRGSRFANFIAACAGSLAVTPRPRASRRRPRQRRRCRARRRRIPVTQGAACHAGAAHFRALTLPIPPVLRATTCRCSARSKRSWIGVGRRSALESTQAGAADNDISRGPITFPRGRQPSAPATPSCCLIAPETLRFVPTDDHGRSFPCHRVYCATSELLTTTF